MKYSSKLQPKRIGVYTQNIVKPVFKARGLMEGKIITHWGQIVGDRFARLALPEKITFPKGQKGGGTLYLSVTSSTSLLIHYAQGLILEHVNTFFGYKAIAKLQLNHGLAPPKTEVEKTTLPLLTGEEKEWLMYQTQVITDPELREQLEKLGEAICKERK